MCAGSRFFIGCNSLVNNVFLMKEYIMAAKKRAKKAVKKAVKKTAKKAVKKAAKKKTAKKKK